MLGLLGWIDGITATGLVMSGVIFFIIFYIQSLKREAKLLQSLAWAVLFAGLLYLGVFVDFIWSITTGFNLSTPVGLVALLSYIWFPPVIISAMYIGLELAFPKYKWSVLGFYIAVGTIFIILIFIDPIGSFYLGTYAPEGEGLIDYNINPMSIAGLVLSGMLFPVVIGLFLAAAIVGKSTNGTIRKQFILLGIGVLSFAIFGIFEGFTQLGIMIIFVRIGYMSSFWWMYLGLTRTVG
ncbi:MAG: hypothetical protein ACTSR8_08420 [Promethearchaeota archaeon]